MNAPAELGAQTSSLPTWHSVYIRLVAGRVAADRMSALPALASPCGAEVLLWGSMTFLSVGAVGPDIDVFRQRSPLPSVFSINKQRNSAFFNVSSAIGA